MGLRVVGIADFSWGDDPATVDAFVAQTGVRFSIGVDTGTFSRWDWPPSPAPFPRQVVLDRQGVVTYIAGEHDAAALDAAIVDALESPVP
jgi:hypothetical protein